MDPPLLQTKLYIPPTRPEYVTRPRLDKMLQSGLSHKLTLLSAPAGYGKTSLISDWASRHERPCAWLSLDRYDNDLPRFLSYLLTSLRTIQIDIDETLLDLPHLESDPYTSFLIPFLNQVAPGERDFILALDDYHRIQNQQVHQAVMYLLDNLPSNMHLLIASRIDPPFRLAKMRALGLLCEIRAEDLRFNQEEAVLFLNQSMKLGLLPEDIAALTRKTEGWITGLQLAAISLRDHPHKASFLRAFAGDDRYIADYLVDEALARQPETVQDFLRQTAILDRLNASLCDAITSREDSQEILTRLERTNLFLIPLDTIRSWYRYHHLFQDLLLHRLRQSSHPEAFAALHRKASDWYLSKGMIVEAIHHAFEADDMRHIVRLIEGNIFSMLDQGGIRLLLSWIDTIPKELRSNRPWLDVAQALVLVYAGDLKAGESALALAEQTLPPLEEQESIRIRTYIDAIRAYSLWIRGLGEEAHDLIEWALSLIPEEERSLQAFANMVLGASRIQCQDFNAAVAPLKRSIELSSGTGNDHIHILASGHLVYLNFVLGKFTEAEMICQEVIAQYDGKKTQTSLAIAQIYTFLGDIYAKRLDVEQALALAEKGLEIGKQWNQIDTVTVCYIYLIEILLAGKEYDQAVQMLDELKALRLDFSPWFKDIIEETEIKIYLSTRNFTAASQWALASGLDYRDPIIPTRRNTYINYIRILLAEGKTYEALHLAERILKFEAGFVGNGVLVFLLPLKSLILSTMGEEEAALSDLSQALAIAEPEGYKRGFVELGEPLIPLLRQAIQAEIHPAFALELLENITGEQANVHKIWSSSQHGKERIEEAILEPLSEREIEVLSWMAKGCTNQEIAQELILSLHTIKSHARNIFGKLGVKNRTEAVARARLLGLLGQA